MALLWAQRAAISKLGRAASADNLRRIARRVDYPGMRVLNLW